MVRMVEEGFGMFHRLYTNVLLCEIVAVCVSAVSQIIIGIAYYSMV